MIKMVYTLMGIFISLGGVLFIILGVLFILNAWDIIS